MRIGDTEHDVTVRVVTEAGSAVAGVNFEEAVGGLGGQGISTRNGGSPIILQLRNFGMPTTQAVPQVGGVAQDHVLSMSGVLMIVVSSIDVICRTGSVEVRE